MLSISAGCSWITVPEAMLGLHSVRRDWRRLRWSLGHHCLNFLPQFEQRHLPDAKKHALTQNGVMCSAGFISSFYR
jgi:hypothetical protein